MKANLKFAIIVNLVLQEEILYLPGQLIHMTRCVVKLGSWPALMKQKAIALGINGTKCKKTQHYGGKDLIFKMNQ